MDGRGKGLLWQLVLLLEQIFLLIQAISHVNLHIPKEDSSPSVVDITIQLNLDFYPYVPSLIIICKTILQQILGCHLFSAQCALIGCVYLQLVIHCKDCHNQSFVVCAESKDLDLLI